MRLKMLPSRGSISSKAQRQDSEVMMCTGAAKNTPHSELTVHLKYYIPLETSVNDHTNILPFPLPKKEKKKV